jgi:hypothetical protein
MPQLTERDAREFIELRAKAHGLTVTQVVSAEAELGHGLINLDLHFKQSPQWCATMETLRRELSAQTGQDVRAGYYERDDDSDDIREGEAMIQFDAFFVTN